MSDMATPRIYTVVMAYLDMSTGHPEARLWTDAVPARTRSIAVAKLAARCPATPTEVFVFEGEHYNRGD